MAHILWLLSQSNPWNCIIQCKAYFQKASISAPSTDVFFKVQLSLIYFFEVFLLSRGGFKGGGG